jgi:excisionase family DNA binding protein
MPSSKSRKSSAVSPAEIPQQQPRQQITPRLLTIKQAAGYLSATVWAVRELLWSDTISHVVIGRRHLVDRGDLDRYIDKELSNCVQQGKSVAKHFSMTSLLATIRTRGQHLYGLIHE